MSVPVAYATMIMIWSTTPLGVTWSNEAFSPIAAVALRMGIAAVIGYAVLRALKIKLAWHKAACRTYAYSLLSVYCAMSLVYMSANYIPSGLISVMFALSPPVANVLSVKFLGQGSFTLARTIAFGISLLGLGIVCLSDFALYDEAWKGIALLLAGVILYSLSGVLVQKESYQAHPLSITIGTLICSVPLFAVTWYLVDGEVPDLVSAERSIMAIVYLAIIGSLIGFACYFHVVNRLGAIAVAMVTLVTPVFALILGSLLNGELITAQTVIGTACVLIGLVLYYQNGEPKVASQAVSDEASSEVTMKSS